MVKPVCKQFRALVLAVTLLGALPAMAAPTVVGAERTRNLRQLDYAPMLLEYHGQTVGEGRAYFTYPRRNLDFRKYFRAEASQSLVAFEDTIATHTFAIAASPVFGIDYRGSEALNDTIWPAFDGGLYLRGYADSVDFDLDARLYSEGHTAGSDGDKRKPKSFDGEVFDVQHEDRGGVNYVSYSRYRAHLGFNYAFVRLQLARDVLHWGPGYYNNLALNQFALPYNMLALDATFGPLRIFSAYADLRVNSWSYSKDNLNDRNLYAHRYELALGNLTVGMSELQVLYNENKPWMFTPVVPLFIEKGNFTERVNNGALALDLDYRLFGMLRLYGEFFLDDMESPYAVYENRYSTRHAFCAGPRNRQAHRAAREHRRNRPSGTVHVLPLRYREGADGAPRRAARQPERPEQPRHRLDALFAVPGIFDARVRGAPQQVALEGYGPREQH